MNVTSYNADPSVERPNKKKQRELIRRKIYFLNKIRSGKRSVFIIDTPNYDFARWMYNIRKKSSNNKFVIISCYNLPQDKNDCKMPSEGTQNLWKQYGIEIHMADIYSIIDEKLVDPIDLIWYDGTGAWDVEHRGLFESPETFFTDLMTNHGSLLKDCDIMLNLHIDRWNTFERKDQMAMINNNWINPNKNKYIFSFNNENDEDKKYNDSGQNMLFLHYSIAAKEDKRRYFDPPFFTFDNIKKDKKRSFAAVTESAEESKEYSLNEDNSKGSEADSEDNFIEDDQSSDSDSETFEGSDDGEDDSEDNFIEEDQTSDSEDSFEGSDDEDSESEAEEESDSDDDSDNGYISDDLSTGNSFLDAEVRRISAGIKRRRVQI